MKVFLSHKMHGLTEAEVMEIRNQALEKLMKEQGDNEEIEIIDNYHHENVPLNAGRLWHLGTSIRQMEEADAIYFCGDPSEAKGSLIEFMIATVYHLRILNAKFDVLKKPEPDYDFHLDKYTDEELINILTKES